MGKSTGRAGARPHRPWRRSAALLAAALGLSLAAPATALAPASAVVLGGIVPPEPRIAPGGAGHIELLGQVVCESDGSTEMLCDALPLSELSGLSTVLVEAVPADPSSTPVWSGCTEVDGELCRLALDLLGQTPLAPMVEFVPAGEETSAQHHQATIAEPRDTRWTQATRTLTFQATTTTGDGGTPTPSDSTVAFECELTYRPPSGADAPAQPQGHARESCGAGPDGSREYTGLVDGSYTFTVWPVDTTEGSEATATSDTLTWTQRMPVPAPETTVTAGPRDNAWVLRRAVRYRFTSSVEGAKFDCWLDGQMQGDVCDDGTWASREAGRDLPHPLRKGSYTFEVGSYTDRSRELVPQTRTFHVPFDDRQLRARGSWTSRKQRGHFRNTFRQSSSKGASLVTRRSQEFRRVALVADKGPGHGTVKVFWRKRMLAEVDLGAKRLRKRRVVPVRTFEAGALRTGRLRIVVTSAGKPVRIDGLALADR